MRLDDALEQLSAMHAQVLRSETFRGYKALPTAATGVLAIAAAVVQQAFLPASAPDAIARYWIALAAIAGVVCGAELTLRTLRDPEPHARRRTGLALRQILPSFGVAAVLTLVLLEVAPELLPAVWAMCFGLGLAASRPFLPGAIGGVAWFYLVTGAVLLLPGLRDPALAPLAMGFTFGTGQLWAAWVLHRAEEVRYAG